MLSKSDFLDEIKFVGDHNDPTIDYKFWSLNVNKCHEE